MAVAERLKRPKYQCGPCMRVHTYQQRSRLKCGWVREEDWAPPEKRERTWGAFAGVDWIPENCPGYTALLPQVQEAARAWGWEQKASGAVRRYEAVGLEFNENISMLVDIFSGAQASAEHWELEERRKKNG